MTSQSRNVVVASRRVFAVRQGTRLSIGVGAATGGVLLLAKNVAGVLAAGWAPHSWVPLTANAALIFGGVMFLREYRRAARERDSAITGTDRLTD